MGPAVWSHDGHEKLRFGPPSLQPVPCYMRRDAGISASVCDGHKAAVECYPPTRPSVVRLFLGCGPAAIPGLIIAVIVWESIQGMIGRWARPHIGVEAFKAITPPVAHRNPATGVSIKSLAVRVKAALFDSQPSVVFRRTRHAVGSECLNCGCRTNASTAFRFPPAGRRESYFRAAVTPALPAIVVPRFSFTQPNGYEVPIPKSSKLKHCHGYDIRLSRGDYQ